ncbi:MAG: hypothetical protein JNJ58_07025 [Chitinophagaceae bacterium]|nr:hypothetical protein [Chitinophagaceae bacterium]
MTFSIFTVQFQSLFPFRILLLLCFPAMAFAQINPKDTVRHVGPKHVHIRNVTFTGNKTTKKQIIEREMSLHEGDSIDVSDVESELDFNKRRILNLQLFSTVNYCIPYWDHDTIDIEYNMTEILYWLASPIFSLADRNFNVWWSEQHRQLDRTNMGLELTRLNFRGRNERLGGTVQVGYNKHFDLFYKIPYVDKWMKHGASLSAMYATGREINIQTDSNKLLFFRKEEYPYRRFQAKAGYSYRKAYAAIHELQFSYNYYSVTQDLYNHNPEYLGQKKRINYFELTYVYTYNNTDIRVYPLNGLDVKAYMSKRGLWIDKDVNQFVTFAEISYYRKLLNNFYGSLVFRGRLSFPQEQPYLFSRGLGFRNEYVRGYEYYVIDGSHYSILRSNVRYKLLDLVWSQNLLKFIKYIPIRVYMKAYDDIGYIYNKYPGNSFLNNKLLHGYGLGMDIVISYYAKFRIEYSFNHLRQNGLFLHGTKE